MYVSCMLLEQPKEGRYAKNAGAVFNLSYHVVWCPKYRRKVLVGDVEQRLSIFCMPRHRSGEGVNHHYYYGLRAPPPPVWTRTPCSKTIRTCALVNNTSSLPFSLHSTFFS